MADIEGLTRTPASATNASSTDRRVESPGQQYVKEWQRDLLNLEIGLKEQQHPLPSSSLSANNPVPPPPQPTVEGNNVDRNRVVNNVVVGGGYNGTTSSFSPSLPANTALVTNSVDHNGGGGVLETKKLVDSPRILTAASSPLQNGTGDVTSSFSFSSTPADNDTRIIGGGGEFSSTVNLDLGGKYYSNFTSFSVADSLKSALNEMVGTYTLQQEALRKSFSNPVLNEGKSPTVLLSHAIYVVMLTFFLT